MTDPLFTRPPVNTGPIELRDFGPNGLRLGAPDVVIVSGLSEPKNEAYHGTPVLAVEVRGTHSKGAPGDQPPQEA